MGKYNRIPHPDGFCGLCGKPWEKNHLAYCWAYNRRRQLKVRYGITPEEYEVLLKKQGGRCGICGRRPSGRRLDIDHNHETGQVRGLLCRRCNITVGVLESIDLTAFTTYLNRTT